MTDDAPHEGLSPHFTDALVTSLVAQLEAAKQLLLSGECRCLILIPVTGRAEQRGTLAGPNAELIFQLALAQHCVLAGNVQALEAEPVRTFTLPAPPGRQ